MKKKELAPVNAAALDAQGRDFSIDLLKTIAIIGVITIHTCTGWAAEIGSFNWVSNLFWGTLLRASVPVFLMCSGALLLDTQRELSVKKLYTKNLAKVFAAMYFWAMAYKGFRLILRGTVSFETIFQSIKEVLVFDQEFHLYYLHIIILVYLFLPVTRTFTGNATKKQFEYFLVVWFVLGILYPTVSGFWPFTLITGNPVKWLIDKPYAAIGYGVLAHYIKRFYPGKPKAYMGIFAAGFAFVFGGTWLMSAGQGMLYQGFLEGMSVGVFLMAAGMFGLALSLRKRPESLVARAVTYISKASFCVYLVHLFYTYMFTHFGITIHLLPYIVSIPLMVAAILVGSIAVYWVLSRIPIVKNWIV